MNKLLIPDVRFASVLDISADFLRSRGVRLLLLDLDNTLVPYSPQVITEELLAWKRSLQDGGVTPVIVSNNRTDMVERFGRLMGVDHFKRARKPRKGGIDLALEKYGVPAANAALAGDQVRTDVAGAKRRGMLAIYVQPVDLKNPLLKLRHLLEKPFINACREIYDGQHQ